MLTDGFMFMADVMKGIELGNLDQVVLGLAKDARNSVLDLECIKASSVK
jgi:hypothetical protein